MKTTGKTNFRMLLLPIFGNRNPHIELHKEYRRREHIVHYKVVGMDVHETNDSHVHDDIQECSTGNKHFHFAEANGISRHVILYTYKNDAKDKADQSAAQICKEFE